MPLIEVQNARFRPCMDSFLGALHGMLVSQECEREMDELWGLSALGFRTQVHATLDPGGLLPRHWDQDYPKIVRRMGLECVCGLRDSFYTPGDLRELQFVWMNALEKALDDGRPAIIFGLHGPAFGIVRGLDNDTEEYHVSTFMDGRKDEPINIQDIGSQNPPLIFVLVPTGIVADYDVNAAARAALRDAVDHHLGQEKDEDGKLIENVPNVIRGPGAYNAWSTAMETALVQPHWGAGLYGAYYAEARSAAAMWLRRLVESPDWIKEAEVLKKVAGHFDHEVECFSRVPALFPFAQPDAIQDPVRRTEAATCLRMARAEHIAGMEALTALVQSWTN